MGKAKRNKKTNKPGCSEPSTSARNQPTPSSSCQHPSDMATEPGFVLRSARLCPNPSSNIPIIAGPPLPQVRRAGRFLEVIVPVEQLSRSGPGSSHVASFSANQPSTSSPAAFSPRRSPRNKSPLSTASRNQEASPLPSFSAIHPSQPPTDQPLSQPSPAVFSPRRSQRNKSPLSTTSRNQETLPVDISLPCPYPPEMMIDVMNAALIARRKELARELVQRGASASAFAAGSDVPLVHHPHAAGNQAASAPGGSGLLNADCREAQDNVCVMEEDKAKKKKNNKNKTPKSNKK